MWVFGFIILALSEAMGLEYMDLLGTGPQVKLTFTCPQLSNGSQARPEHFLTRRQWAGSELLLCLKCQGVGQETCEPIIYYEAEVSESGPETEIKPCLHSPEGIMRKALHICHIFRGIHCTNLGIDDPSLNRGTIQVIDQHSNGTCFYITGQDETNTGLDTFITILWAIIAICCLIWVLKFVIRLFKPSS
eukprot:maker-scaffold495_size155559-snap-gene-0.41 protein:Tk09246 transcript:maker-scaffold495_size155559-snap-gene-0.41-mRNA-1 annotation:"protein serine threonine phosphatase"